MRRALLAATLSLAIWPASVAPALDIEAERIFSTPGASSKLNILSTVDLNLFAPLVAAFQSRHPKLAIRYTVVSSAALYKGLAQGSATADLAISSAMDLQMKLANDGFARAHRSAATAALPGWARWRDVLFAFTQEPAVVIVSRKAFAGLPLPKTRADLIALLRAHPERFRGRIGTYDIRRSGLGYLFATQDARQSDAYWRLTQEMGGLAPKLYCCSAKMIDDLRAGRIALAYNVLGSYAAAEFLPGGDQMIVPMTDYTQVMLRTALIPTSAQHPKLGAAFLDFLVGAEGRGLIRKLTGLPPVDAATLFHTQYLRPIRLGPGLLVYLDRLKRQNFIREWTAALDLP